MLRNKQNSKQYVPLKRVNIAATIRSFAADVSITQLFRNEESTSIEAVYCFPIEEQAAIYSFIARIDDREIIAELKEKKIAQKEYSEALQSGHGAYLLEQDEKSQDNFIINVGALPSGKECQIEICYVTELNLVENGEKIRFVVPTTIAPRYNPDKGSLSSPAGTTSKYVQSVPYTISFHCQVEKYNIASISSSSHPVQMDLNKQDYYVITFAQEKTCLDRDILLDMQLIEHRSNTILTVENGAMMVSFTPNEEDCQQVTNNKEVTNEFIFIVDCSGSMDEENKIGLARQAMLLFLKSLPVNCYFNIIRFGSNHQSLFPEMTVVYNEINSQKAEHLTKTMRADLGGTELLSTLQWLEKNPVIEGRARQIFLLTDGEVSNVNEVIDLCRTMATTTRIFSFGLGSSPSRSLVKGLARSTNGRFVFIPPHTSVDIHVGEQLQKALQSCITNVEIKWNLDMITSVPSKIPPVYVNDRLIVYALAKNSSIRFYHNLRVELTCGQHRLGEAKVNIIPNVSNNNETIGRLAAKALIVELQHEKLPSSTQKMSPGSLQTRFQEHQKAVNNDDESAKEIIKKRIIELSLKYHILSPHTAFIGVEKRLNGNNSDMVLREVPIQISADDQHLHSHHQTYSSSYSTASAMIDSDCSDDCDEDFCDYSMSYSRRYHQSLLESEMSVPLPDDDEDDDEDDTFQSRNNNNFSTQTTDLSVTNDEDIVRYLINKQKFDGSWQIDENNIEKLTKKPLTTFTHMANKEILLSSIIIAILETRFASLSSMWYGIVQKARKYLLNLLGNDMTKLNKLLEDVRKQF
ncbi:hypothetical protein I4U23_022187 [Adineta vaga]|nr:hypothetical protein I4U23_022187 [Adineta vaga]